MIRAAGDRLVVEGPMTLATATALLDRGSAMLVGSRTVFDLRAVEEVDSSGLAVVFGWLRAARQSGGTAAIANPPANLLSLAEVYGVAGLLPLA